MEDKHDTFQIEENKVMASIINPSAKFGRERTDHRNEYKAGTPGGFRREHNRTLNKIQAAIRESIDKTGARKDFVRQGLLGGEDSLYSIMRLR
jgi:hypothetical protein